MRKRISKAFDQFIDVNLKSDKEVAQLSRDLKIDIAVDLKGFSRNLVDLEFLLKDVLPFK